jgi:predicted DNA-binding transcriptional regulator YafY
MAGKRSPAKVAEQRTGEALQLLQLGRSASGVVSELAQRWGVSERQAARYVSAARRRCSWGVVGETLAQPLHQALGALQDLAVEAAEAGDLREANKAWATFSALLKTAGRVDSYNVWEVSRDALGAVEPVPYPEAPDDTPPF